MNGRPPPDRFFHLSMFGICLAILIAACVLQVDSNAMSVRLPGLGRLPETCYLRSNTGVPCPGCGLTRSFISIAHGEIVRAWQFNPAGPFLFLIVACQIPYRAWQYWRLRTGRPETNFGRWEWWPMWAVLVMLFGQWIVRMIGGW